jgi:thiol-disulfide isomerase/thioredoxin
MMKEGFMTRSDDTTISSPEPLLVEIISEGPHCVPCEYAIAAVDYVAENYENRIRVSVVETKTRVHALRYLELVRTNGGRLPVPSILFNGRLIFDEIPGPDVLCRALDAALLDREKNL